MKLVLSGIFLLTLFVPVSHLHADIIIDDFNAGGFFLQSGQGSNMQSTSDAFILGGSRTDFLNVPDTGAANFGLMNFTGQLALAQGNGDEISGSMTYSGMTNFDLTGGGTNDSFGFMFVGSDSISTIADVVTLTVDDGVATQSVTFSVPGQNALPQETLLGFDQFAGIDFTSIDSIEMSFDFAGQPGRDFTLDFFGATSAVPEPTAVGVSALMMAGLAMRRRRKSTV